MTPVAGMPLILSLPPPHRLRLNSTGWPLKPVRFVVDSVSGTVLFTVNGLFSN